MQDLATTSSRIRRAATALLIVLTAAACRDDATSPNEASPAAIEHPQAALLPQGVATISVRVVNIQGVTINENMAIKVFLNGSASDTVVVRDQDTSVDRDLTTGLVRFTVPMRSFYRVCAFDKSPSYAADLLDACHDVVGGRRSAVDAGSVLAHRMPIVAMALRSTTGEVLHGAAVGWTSATGAYVNYTAKEGGNTGQIVSVVPFRGTNVYCETKAPKGYAFAVPQCAAMELDWDQFYIRPLFHELAPKVLFP